MTTRKRMYVLCWLVLTINLTQRRITWGESFNKELHRASWPVSMSWGGGGFVNRCRRLSPLWVVPFPSQEGSEQHKEEDREHSASKDVFIPFLSVDMI